MQTQSPRPCIVDLRVPEPSVEPGKIACEVLDLNRFGNVQLNVRSSHLAAAGLDQADRISVDAHSGNAVVKPVSTYADLAERRVGPDGRPARLALGHSRPPANAAAGLGVANDDLVWLSRERD